MDSRCYYEEEKLMNRARILAKNHTVIPYVINGRKRHVVETHNHPSTIFDRIVFNTIHETGFNWADVYNNIDWTLGYIDKKMEHAIDQHTI